MMVCYRSTTRASLGILLLTSGICASAPGAAQIALTGVGNPPSNVICGPIIGLSDNNDNCANVDSATGLSFGLTNQILLDGTQAQFNVPVNFNSINVQFNSSNVAFGGGSATFNNTVSFVGPSVTFGTGTTFNNAADFNAAITTSGISNTGSLTTTGLTAVTAIVSNFTLGASLTVLGGANINMGDNQLHGVAAGTADTDAVNVAQLNAATSGITADVTALETVTATHTTQITMLETGLADTNAALSIVDTRVDALEAITANLDERFDNVEDRSDAGTATAVALSGAMFLPEKTFNLTANVGAYRGAVAGALQIGALVSDMVAVNAGVAHGFNKGGKTALRAGFTLGW